MRAIVVRRRSDPHLQIEEVPAPVCGDRDVLVDVKRIALNPGELRGTASLPDGARIGWDFAGEVVQAAANDAGPPVGERVVGTVRAGAWAEQVAVPVEALAVVPHDLELELAVCVPVPGLAAYEALARTGLAFRKRILVTGAGGAVGQYACQMAVNSGALVAGAIRDSGEERTVRSHCVADIRTCAGVEAFRGDAFDLVIDTVGGALAGPSIELLAPNGRYVAISDAGGDTLHLPFMTMFSGGVSAHVVNVFSDTGRRGETRAEALSRILSAVADGSVTVPAGSVHDWADIDEVARSYLSEGDRAKPVLTIDGAGR
ncbi:MAG: zinc-binding dehydrogenase [Pseudomonadota bacterium]